MRLPFRDVDDQVGVQERSTDEVAVIALAVVFAGLAAIVIVDREPIGAIGNLVEVAG